MFVYLESLVAILIYSGALNALEPTMFPFSWPSGGVNEPSV